jgi:hypothetical protein
MRIDRQGIFIITIFTSLIIIFNVLFLNIVPLNTDASFTGYAVVEPKVVLEMDNDRYTPGQKLEGNINVTFYGNIDGYSTIDLEFNGEEESVKIKDYFRDINKSVNSTPEEITITNGGSSKDINLTAGIESQIGLKLPRGATVNSLVMSVRGSPTNPTRLLSFDIPEGSQKPEWQYLGDFLNKFGQPIHPEGLDLQSGNSVLNLESNTTYYCEQIDLPYARDYQVSAKYRPVTGSTAGLQAVILTYTGGIAEGGGDKCNLPRGGTDLAWNNCTITFTNGLQGYYMVCLQIVGPSERAYEVVRDDSASSSRFNCDIGLEESYGTAFCTQAPSRNYFIRVYPGIYNDNLTGIISTTQFPYWGTDRDFSDSLTAYLMDCTPDNIGDCSVIMNVKSETTGSVTLRDLRIDYTEEAGGSSYATQFYDLSTTSPEIYEIDGKKLNKTTFMIPLSFFNATTPNVTKKQQMEVFVEVAGDSDTADIEVYSTNVPEELGEIDEQISEALGKLNTIKSNEINWILQVDDDVLTLTNYKDELKGIREENISMEEKEGRLAVIEDEIRNFIDPLPSGVTKISETRDTLLANPSDVEELFTEGADEIFQYQEKASVAVTLSVFKVTKNDGTSEAYSVIKKNIQPKGTVKDVYVYEVIPKSVAQSTSDITFEKENYEVENADPVVKYYYSTLTSTVITYAVKTMVTSQNMYNIKTLIVPKKIPTPEVPKEYTCGDGICSKPDEDEKICPEDCKEKMSIPWLWIIIILVILVAAIVYINFYKGKLSVGDIRKKLSPFKTEKDLENVKTYIRGQLEKKVKKTEISKALLEKGWTKEQVEYAFEDIKWDKKREETMKKAPTESEDMKKLDDYIKKCKDLKIAEPKITASLKAKGWKETVIKQALLRAGIHTEQREENKENAKPFFDQQKGL